MISEIDLPTEPSVSSEKETVNETEKSETFVELYDKYDEQFIKNSTTELKDVFETPPQKRSSANEGDDIDAEVDSKSIIEKIQTIDDPEVRKEFELELNNNGQITGTDKEITADVGTEYDPNYSRKIISNNENQVELINSVTSELGNSIEDFNVDGGKPFITEFTTVEPEDFVTEQNSFKNPEIIDVIEQVFYQPRNVEVSEGTTIDPLNVQVDFDPVNVQEDFDPIEIINPNSYQFRRIDVEATTLPNDKFVGFEQSVELNEPSVETTESSSYDIEEETAEQAAKVIVDSLAIVGLLGKSLNLNSYGNESILLPTEDETVKKEETIPEQLEEKTTEIPPAVESVTEIVEVNTEITISVLISDSKENSDSSDSKKSSGVSSEESNSSKSSEKKEKTEKKEKIDKNSSESSEENTAKEIFDKEEFGLEMKENQKKLMEELYKDTMNHEVKKKDHPIVLNVPHEDVERKLVEDNQIVKIFEDETESFKAEKVDETTVGIYETFEDVVTTISDGIKLTNELRSSVDSFRSNSEENKTILDTNNEAISSKNIKNSLVNIAEEMTLEDHSKSAVNSKISLFTLSITGFVSLVVVTALYVILKKQSARAALLFQ